MSTLWRIVVYIWIINFTFILIGTGLFVFLPILYQFLHSLLFIPFQNIDYEQIPYTYWWINFSLKHRILRMVKECWRLFYKFSLGRLLHALLLNNSAILKLPCSLVLIPKWVSYLQFFLFLLQLWLQFLQLLVWFKLVLLPLESNIVVFFSYTVQNLKRLWILMRPLRFLNRL